MRGLTPFGENERDQFRGRVSETEEITKLVRSDYFKAGLIYGESGVGKTSLLNAGIYPYLREHGVVVLTTNAYGDPLQGFVESASHATGLKPRDNEDAITFLSRIVSEAPSGQQYLLALDDADIPLRDANTAIQLGDAYARIVSRSSGKGRFLFCCDRKNTYALTALEKRTGSIFPANCRYELLGLQEHDAANIIAEQFAGTLDIGLLQTVTAGLQRYGLVKPTDLQLATLALRDLKINSLSDLESWGGASQLTERWLEEVLSHMKDSTMCHRVAHALAKHEWTNAENLNQELTCQSAPSLDQLYRFGVIQLRGQSTKDGIVSLAHPVLKEPLLRVTRHTQELAADAASLLSEAAAENKRLGYQQLKAIKKSGVQPTTAQQQTVLSRTNRFYKTVLAAAFLAPILLCGVIWMVQKGSTYYETSLQGGPQTLAAHSGRAGLFSAFHWLGFGDRVEDTGISKNNSHLPIEKYVSESANSRESLYKESLQPELLFVSNYLHGEEADPSKLTRAKERKEASFRAFAQIAGPSELSLVKKLLSGDSATDRVLAKEVASVAANRKTPGYAELLQLQPQATTGPASFGSQLVTRLRQDIEPLNDEKITKSKRARAVGALERALRGNHQTVIETALNITGKERFWILTTLAAQGNETVLKPHITNIRRSVESEDSALSSAAWAALATAAPADVVGELAVKIEGQNPSAAYKKQISPAWGYIARSRNDAAKGAFDVLLSGLEGRALAPYLEAYGYVGKRAIAKINALEKTVPASIHANALVNVVAGGGSSGPAMAVIGKLWKKKGASQVRAARLLRRLARYSRSAPINLLRSAANDKASEQLRILGAEGLCNAFANKSKNGRKALSSLTNSPSAAVRSIVVECFQDVQGYPSTALAVAKKLKGDASATIQHRAAELSATLTTKPPKGLGTHLKSLLSSGNLQVRTSALQGLAALKDGVPKGTSATLASLFSRAGLSEKRAILQSADFAASPKLLETAMSDGSEIIRREAVELSARSSVATDSTFAKALSDGEKAVQVAALGSLSEKPDLMKQDKIRSAVSAAAGDPDPEITTTALAAIASYDSKNTRKYFEPLIDSPSEQKQIAAATALGKLPTVETDIVLSLLDPLLQNPAYDVRLKAFDSASKALYQSDAATISKIITKSAMRPTKRLAALAALASKAGDGDSESSKVLAQLTKDALPSARYFAKLADAAIAKKLNPSGILRLYVP